MTREETKKLLMIINATYPNFNPENLTFTVNAWTELLKEYRYEDVIRGFKIFIASDGGAFAPSVSQLINSIYKTEEVAYPTEVEAWQMVSKACSNGCYNSVEEFARLPQIVQKAVGSASNIRKWAIMDSGTFHTVIQSNFLRAYRTAIQADRDYKRYPSEIKALVDSTARMMIGVNNGE